MIQIPYERGSEKDYEDIAENCSLELEIDVENYSAIIQEKVEGRLKKNLEWYSNEL